MPLGLLTAIASFFFSAAPACHATTYFINATTGSDSNPGTSRNAPWRSLEKVNSTHLAPGDRVPLHAGSRWQGQLVPSGSGSPAHPIAIDRYGSGPLPRIDGNGLVEDVLQLVNVEYIEVRHVEITNHGQQPTIRRGVLVAAVNFGTAHHLHISDLYIHDVNGTNEHKENGGILFRTVGDKKPSRFDDLVIERNIVWKVDRSAIVAQSTEYPRSRWFPSIHVMIRDNYVDDIGGDGIVPWATDGAFIEHNIALRCNQRAESYNAGIWPWSTDNSLFELNEAAYTHSTRDGEGFDSDYNSRNTRFLYNYSHDNEGGFMLICSPGQRNPEENIGNSGTTVRHNISRNDHARIFHLSGGDQTTIDSNAIYTAPNDDVQVVLLSSWGGWSRDVAFRDNLFDVAGTGRYGHGFQRNPDGTYAIAPGWGGATGIEFHDNHYFGHNIDAPADAASLPRQSTKHATIDWNEPIFDPAHPAKFSRYLAKHRHWLLHLFASQFGSAPLLEEPLQPE